jgi:hypothetical protein
MVRPSASRVHTLHSRTTRLSVLFAPSTTPCVHLCFKPTYLTNSGLRHSLWQHTLSTDVRESHKLARSITQLHGSPPTYATLRMFSCLYYPNVASTLPHKLSPRSMPCVFLGYPSQYRGYRFYNPVSGKILISHHVIFDETVFPFQLAASQAVSPPPSP